MEWKELIETKPGTILKDWYDEGVRCIIVRGPSALCAYLGVPKGHPLDGFHYDAINVNCHGGLTFSGVGGDGYRPEGFYWYGWDYGHSGDYSFYYDNLGLEGLKETGDKKWLIEDVEKDMWEAIYDFKKLMTLSEKISNNKILGME